MRRLAFRTALPLLALASLARAGGSMEQLLDDGSLLADERRDVYVVEVVKVEDEGATQEKPPKVSFKVREAIRGKLKAGDELPALWMPVQHDIDYVGGNAAERLKAWNSTAMKGPEKGQVFIVMNQGLGEGEMFRVSFRCRFEFSEKARDYVVKTMKEGRERVEAFEKAEKEHKAAVDKRRAEDVKVLEAIDVVAAAKAAPVVAVGFLGGYESDRRDVRVSLTFHTVLKSPDDTVPGQVIFQFQLDPTEDERLTLEARSTDPATQPSKGWDYPRVIVFFHAPEDRQSPTKVKFVNGLASVIPATPERLKQVREALGLKDEGK